MAGPQRHPYFRLPGRHVWRAADICQRGNAYPPDKLKSIFEKFVRLDDARSGDTGGAGLGLAIVKQVIMRHGGVITAESDADSTRFVILLPASPPRQKK